MKRVLVILLVQFSLQMVSALEEDKYEVYFPTGMRWKEVLATPGVPLDTVAANIYEIGGDTLIGAKTYKEVFRNEEQCQLWIREEGQTVWLLTTDYPSEIKLYDFGWDNSDVETEVIKEKDGNMELCSISISINNSKVADIDSNSYEYIADDCRVLIRGIGCVSELNRDACMLGYKLPEIILPGMIYHKVLWICRNGKKIFYSNDSSLWIDTFPCENRSYLVTEGKQWAVATYTYKNEYWTDTYRLQGDTIINGKTYKIEYAARHEDLSDMRPSGRYMREEDGKVYSITDKDQRDDFVFDYSMEIGDTLFYNPRIDYYGNEYKHPVCLRLVAIRDTIMPNGDGRVRKCYDTEEGFLNNDDVYEFNIGGGTFYHSFIEDIGYTNRGLSSSEIGTDGVGYALLYVKQDGTMLYQLEEGLLWQDNTCVALPTKRDIITPHYDLQGRPVATPTCGIYIKDGKKVVINSEL